MSAITGEGVETYLHRVEELITRKQKILTVTVKPEDGASLSWIYRHGTVLDRIDTEDGVQVEAKFSPENLGRLEKLPVAIR